MSEALVFIATAMSLSMLCGAAFTIGVMAVCRIAEWSPVNCKINIYNPPGIESAVSIAPTDPRP